VPLNNGPNGVVAVPGAVEIIRHLGSHQVSQDKPR
jgi:hypothetical protein